MSKIGKNEIQLRIEKLIADGYLEDAFSESQKLSFRDKDSSMLVNFKAQYNQAKFQFNNKDIEYKEFTLEENRIQKVLLELIHKALDDEKPSNIDKTIAFLKRFWAIIGGFGVMAALLSDSKSILDGCNISPKNETKVYVDSLNCGFPKTFKDDSLYILITAFEDDAQKYGSDCFGTSLLRRIDAKKMPIKICYRPDLSPKQRDEVKRIQNKYNADLVLWGNLKNLTQNCGEGDICFKSSPSDTIIKICDGEIETEKFDLKYEKGISSQDIEEGSLHIGSIAFDSWIFSIFNSKVGKKKPDFFVVDKSLPRKKQAELWSEKGDLFRQFKNFSKSIECYDESILLNPNEQMALYGRGLANVNLKNYSSAILDIDKVVNLNPKNDESYLFRGLINRIALKFVEAKADFDTAITINPNNADAYLSRAELKKDVKDFVAAKADLDTAIVLEPNNLYAYVSRGELKKEMKDFINAIHDLDTAIELEPNNESAYISRGESKKEMKDFINAIHDLDTAILLQPSNAYPYIVRADLKKEIKDLNGAILDFNTAIQIDTNIEMFYFFRARLRNDMKDFKGAIIDYNKVEESNSDFKIELTDILYTSRGESKLNLRDFNGAISDFNKAIQIDSNKALTYYRRGTAYEKINEEKRAEIDFNKAKSLDIGFKRQKINWYKLFGKAFLVGISITIFLFLLKKQLKFLLKLLQN